MIPSSASFADSLVPAQKNEGELDKMLDGPFRSYSISRRVLMCVLMPGLWIVAWPNFIDLFIAHAVDLHNCTCVGAPLPQPNASDPCGACAAAGGHLVCHDDTTLASDFGLYCEDDWQRGLLPSFYFVGVAIGAHAGFFSDLFGRRRTLIPALALAVIAAPASAFAPSFAAYATCKVAQGIGLNGAAVPGFTLTSEVLGPRLRVVLGIELWSYAWALMSCICPVVSLAMPAARWQARAARRPPRPTPPPASASAHRAPLSCVQDIVLVVSIPGVALLLAMLALVPESPYWLLRRGRHAEVERVLRQLLGRPDPNRLLHGAEEVGGAGGAGGAGEAAAAPIATDTPWPGPAGETQSSSSAAAAAFSSELPHAAGEAGGEAAGEATGRCSILRSLFCRRREAIVTLSQMYLWVAVALSYFAISFNSAQLSANRALNVLLVALPMFPAYFLSARLVDWPPLGRRGTATCALLICGKPTHHARGPTRT